MEESPKYRLIKPVDPTKIKVPLREKFALLTLSSKKKRDKQKDQQESVQLGKRQSASRNLIESLSGVEENNDKQPKGTKATMNVHNKEPTCSSYINPILRSDSSSKDSNANEAHVQCADEEDPNNETYCSQLFGPLHSIEDLNPEEHELELLSRKVSSLTVNTISASSKTTTGDEHELTQLVSTESQRLSSDPRLTQALLCPKSLTQHADDSIYISSTDEEYDEDAESAITISDASSSNAEEDLFPNYDKMTSQIPATGQTADALLPDTLSNDRADRMLAFLRDVSQQRREMELNNELISQKRNTPKRSSTAEIKVDFIKSHSLKTADTESMTENDYILNAKRALALDDTMPMSQTHSSIFVMQSHQMSVSNDFIANKQDDDCNRRLACDDTEVNTLSSEQQNNSLLTNDSVTQNSLEHSVIPDESIEIPETSAESFEADVNVTTQETGNTSSSNELRLSEQMPPSNSESPATSSLSTTQMPVSMTRINISAKINIKIHISQRESSSADEFGSYEDDNDLNYDDDNATGEKKNACSLPASEESNESNDACSQQRQNKTQTKHTEQVSLTEADTIEEPMSPNDKENANEDENKEELDEYFMQNAEKLLTQVYGKAWQTPEVIRTLKRTSGSAKNKAMSDRKTPTAREQKFTPKSKDKRVVEESILDDFSIFQRNIAKTDLDSTRYITTPQKLASDENLKQSTKSRQKQKTVDKQQQQSEVIFKMPQTESKKRIVSTKCGRVVQKRWRPVQDDNNSDIDDDADSARQFKSDDSSHHSWSKSSSSVTDDDVSDCDKKKKDQRRNKKTQSSNVSETQTSCNNTRAAGKKNLSKDKLIYLDLSKNEVEVQDGAPTSPPANNDENFNTHLEDILRTCKRVDKPKMEATPKTTKRKLFTAYFGKEEEENLAVLNSPVLQDEPELLADLANVRLKNNILPKGFGIFNKPLEAVKSGKPVFKMIPPTAAATTTTPVRGTPKSGVLRTPTSAKQISYTKGGLYDKISQTPDYKYGFLKSLDVCVSKTLCHPDALNYRERFNQKREELARILYELYNEKLFQNRLNVPLVWNKKLSNTAGRCLNKKKMGVRSSVVELSEKVLTSADRLRCTLIHELCHAATWVFNGEGGHGSIWKEWARKANQVFPELPKIGVCHQYEIEYKYTYKCTLCGAKSHAHSKSKKVENIRCSYCHGAIEVFLNKKDKDGNVLPTPVKEPTGFAKFVKDNYKQHKRPDLKHADVMKILSNEFAALKVAENVNE